VRSMSRNLRVWSTARKWGQPGSRGVQVSGAGPAALDQLAEMVGRVLFSQFTHQPPMTGPQGVNG